MAEIERSSWWRSSSPPTNWSRSCAPRHGVIVLPLHLCWSGPSSELNLDDPAELRVVYATVLREGSSDDVRDWIHPATLLDMWDSLWLPAAVHEAWDGWIEACRVHAAV
jgi:hypothetical protein